MTPDDKGVNVYFFLPVYSCFLVFIGYLEILKFPPSVSRIFIGEGDYANTDLLFCNSPGELKLTRFGLTGEFISSNKHIQFSLCISKTNKSFNSFVTSYIPPKIKM